MKCLYDDDDSIFLSIFLSNEFIMYNVNELHLDSSTDFFDEF